MNGFLYQILFLLGWISMWAIRFPYIRQSLKTEGTEHSVGKFDQFLVGILFLGTSILPLIYILTLWLDFANYTLPNWISILSVAFLVLALVILRKAHIDLGQNYSQDLEIKDAHELVTGGIYKYVRHPMYSAGFLMSISQIGLLQNWIAGLSGITALVIFYLLRAPIEEEMMIKAFGEEYESYRSRTNRLIPFV